jgi:hypothetical protein
MIARVTLHLIPRGSTAHLSHLPPYPVAVRPSSALPPASLNEPAKPCRVASVTNTRKEERGHKMLHAPSHSSRDYRPRSQKVPEAPCDQYAVQLQSKCNALHGNVACLVPLICLIVQGGNMNGLLAARRICREKVNILIMCRGATNPHMYPPCTRQPTGFQKQAPTPGSSHESCCHSPQSSERDAARCVNKGPFRTRRTSNRPCSRGHQLTPSGVIFCWRNH